MICYSKDRHTVTQEIVGKNQEQQQRLWYGITKDRMRERDIIKIKTFQRREKNKIEGEHGKM